MLWVVEDELETLKWTFIYTHSIIIEQKFDSEYTKLRFCITRIKCRNLLNPQYFHSVHSSKDYYHHPLLSSFCNMKFEITSAIELVVSEWVVIGSGAKFIRWIQRYNRNENNKLNKVLLGSTSELFFLPWKSNVL